MQYSPCAPAKPTGPHCPIASLNSPPLPFLHHIPNLSPLLASVIGHYKSVKVVNCQKTTATSSASHQYVSDCQTQTTGGLSIYETVLLRRLEIQLVSRPRYVALRLNDCPERARKSFPAVAEEDTGHEGIALRRCHAGHAELSTLEILSFSCDLAIAAPTTSTSCTCTSCFKVATGQAGHMPIFPRWSDTFLPFLILVASHSVDNVATIRSVLASISSEGYTMYVTRPECPSSTVPFAF